MQVSTYTHLGIHVWNGRNEHWFRFSQLRRLRQDLLSALCDPSLDSTLVRDLFDQYISLILGFIISPDGSSDDSKLRYTTKFYYSDSLTGTEIITDVQDAQYELCCMMINMALWYQKHAAFIAAKSTLPNDKDALDIHKSLRMSAGIFKHVLDVELRKLTNVKLPPCSDLNEKILGAYSYQSLAEFHEVTVARAMNLKQDNALISSIANQISQYFDIGGQQLTTFDDKITGKWRMYFQLKAKFYLAEARAYQALSLLDKNDGGAALKAVEEAFKVQQQANAFCEEYAKKSALGTQAIPKRHPFFLQLDSMIRRIQSTTEFENTLIHHKKIADECPPLEPGTHGILPPEEYVIPKLNSLFSADAYRAFDIGKNAGKPLKEDKKAREVKEMKEIPIPQGHADPNQGGSCIIA
ncbi:unnamed protein product [Didymodactylos carnosus]|uniref:BRO1 domain-containing protein n=1 Tax=Didymodactylos carnosus TaxID=1234261 RepID=A0A8S2DB76_9BILA|nr:unnamed protein product [Didymodactylos carnosus]CAF3634970.1 unnamed protein product [Didymodactylos carnosus]